MVIKGLTFSYDTKPLFEDFNFESENKIIALKGPSGCGKTTLLKIISKNLIPQKCTEIKYNPNTFLVIQEDGLFPWLTGEQNIINFININKEEIQLNQLYVVVKAFISKKAFEMSYGQRRLIELFRSILAKPNLLLLDEPFNFLDKNNRSIVTQSLLKLSENDCEIIFTSHYKEDKLDFEVNTFYFDGTFPINRLING